MTEECMVLVKEGKGADMLLIPAGHRASLLSLVHTGQKRIDCLDFLVYKINGKTIVPFCTSHSTGIGSSASNLHAFCPDSVKWAEGKRFEAGTPKEAREEWLAENGLKKPVEETGSSRGSRPYIGCGPCCPGRM